MYIGGRPASAKSLTPDQASAVMQELKEVQTRVVTHPSLAPTKLCPSAQVKQQIEAERSVLADQQHRFVSERTKLASRLTETVSICPEPTEKLSSGITGEWSELHSLANQLAVGATQVCARCTRNTFLLCIRQLVAYTVWSWILIRVQLSMMVETRDATIARLEVKQLPFSSVLQPSV